MTGLEWPSPGISACQMTFSPVYAGVSLEYGNVFQNSDEIQIDNGLLAGSLWLGLDTPIGPVYLASGWAEGGNNAFYLSLGQRLGVNAKRGILRR